jgi:sigma-B regulation protein RsbU (phosphoserine phosphatase)
MTETTTHGCHRPPAPPGGLAPRRLRVAGDLATVRTARHLLGEALSEYPSDLRATAVLLAGELVSNAVVHGGDGFLLQADATQDRVRVEVTDSATGQPRVLQVSDHDEHGRGMAIVDAIATKWGTDRLEDRKVVWFEICFDP